MFSKQFGVTVQRWLLLACVVAGTADQTARAQQPAPGAGRYALLVGVNQYEKRGFRDLEFAQRDVEQMAEVLRGMNYDVTLLTADAPGERRATLANIQAALDKTLTGRTKRDLVLFGFAGHGFQIEKDAGNGKLASDSYFCPVDAVKGEADTMLSISTLFEKIDKHGGGQNFVLLDACREDPTRGRGLDGSRVQSLPEGVAVLFGCGAGQKTFETPSAGGGHGVFFHFVLEGLKGEARNDDGDITWSRLAEYVSQRVEEQTPTLLNDQLARQTPYEVKNLPGRSPVLGRIARPAAGPRIGEVITNSLDMQLVSIPAGEFQMGNAEEPLKLLQRFDVYSATDIADNYPLHKVKITKPFYMGMHEVTLGQFLEFYHDAGYRIEGERDGQGGLAISAMPAANVRPWDWGHTDQTNDHPVVNVTWNDAQEFCRWLSKKEGKTYRLPTEAEWEYCCKAGRQTQFWFGDDPEQLVGYDNVADQSHRAVHPDPSAVVLAKLGTNSIDATRIPFPWLRGNDGYAYTAPVGSLRANPFGLYDMHGNVSEWCADFYGADYYGNSPVSDPKGPATGTAHVDRGGAFWSIGPNSRSTVRWKHEPSYRGFFIGFRVVCEM